MILISKTAKIVTGATHPDQWQVYSESGIFVDIDATFAGFSKTPIYLASMGGNGSHWFTTGATSIYYATPTGFRVYVRFCDDRALTPDAAKEFGWFIQWVGIEEQVEADVTVS